MGSPLDVGRNEKKKVVPSVSSGLRASYCLECHKVQV